MSCDKKNKIIIIIIIMFRPVDAAPSKTFCMTLSIFVIWNPFWIIRSYNPNQFCFIIPFHWLIIFSTSFDTTYISNQFYFIDKCKKKSSKFIIQSSVIFLDLAKLNKNFSWTEVVY